MSTATEPTPAAIADILDKAADHLARVGLTKGYLYDEAQADEENTARKDCRVCAAGAINVAVHGVPSYSVTQVTDEQRELEIRAEEELGEYLGLDNITVPQWNDDKDRTADEVIAAFRETAAGLREAS